MAIPTANRTPSAFPSPAFHDMLWLTSTGINSVLQAFELRCQAGNIALIGKAEIARIADYQMLVNRYADTAAGENKFPCDSQSFFRWLRIPGRVVMGKNYRRGTMMQRGDNNFPRVYAAPGQSPFKQVLHIDDPVFGIQENRDETLFGEITHGEAKEIKQIL